MFIKHNPDSTLQQEMTKTNANNIGTNSQIKQIIFQIFSTISLTSFLVVNVIKKIVENVMYLCVCFR